MNPDFFSPFRSLTVRLNLPASSRFWGRLAALCVVALVLCAAPGRAQEAGAGARDTNQSAASPVATRLTPRAEIDSLLAYVRGLDGATFLRNGASHDARQAEAHLRLKWRRQEKAIKTAEDFIARCGSRSSTTGRPYRIRFADGTVRDAESVLKERLRQLRDGASPEPSAP